MRKRWSIVIMLSCVGALIGTMGCSALKREPVLGNAQSTFTANGSFERVEGNELVDWQSRGDVHPEAVDKGWIKKTLRFKSGKHRATDIFFYGNQGCMGSIWIDNFTCPKLQIKNPSFEELDSDGRPALWTGDYTKDLYAGDVALFSDSTRASDGKRCVRLTFANEAVPCTRIWQNVQLQPDQEYIISYDCLVGDDFQGEVHSAAYSGSSHITLDYTANSVNGLLETRDRCEKYAVAMTATAEIPAEIFQEIEVPPEVNLEARMDIRNQTFKGMLSLVLQDTVSGKVLKKTDIQHIEPSWQTVETRFQSASSTLRMHLSARGEGMLEVDNVAVAFPTVVPPLQQARWLPVSDNFQLPSSLKISIQGGANQAMDGGLELLGNDLEAYGVVLEKTGPEGASLRILTGPQHAIEGRGDESYALTVNRKGIVIKAAREAGAFYGLMTLLQLIEEDRDKPIVLACEVVDFPDMPMRGVLYAPPEMAARWKMNTMMYSTGYPVKPDQREAFRTFVSRCQSLNMDVIPYFLSLLGGQYVQRQNPNLAAGIWVKGEEVTLKGTAPSPLANSFVIRTELTDVTLTSSDGETRYHLGKDYEIIDGDISWPYTQENPEPFAVARLAESSIPDGATVLAGYDHVSCFRKSTGRSEDHLPYCQLEPEVRRHMGDFMKNLAGDFPIPYINTSHCLEEFRPSEAQLETDGRVIRSGKSPIDLLAEDVCFLDRAAKSGNPKTRILQWAGSVNDYCREAGPKLPKDALINVWGYEVNWPAAHGREALAYWSELGFETSVMPWDNLRNVRGWAQVVAEARRKGYPCVGMIDSCWAKRQGGVKETAIVSWKIPREGERGFVALKTP